ncbi:MAG: GNAT family N-acetyltransferase [Actinomycetaceae bacterium]|nr:GNAT family N-acetyltransferase [Actinomycetaceae bacterium]
MPDTMPEGQSQKIQWTILRENRAQDVLSLVLAIEEADRAPYRSDLGEVEEFFSDVWITRLFGGRAPNGELIAFGLVRMPATHGETVEISLWGGIHPEWRNRGLGRELVGMQVRAGREIASESGVREASLVMHVDEGHDDLTDLLNRDGFVTKQSYVQMRRSLKEPVVVPDASAFISLVPLTEEFDAQVRVAHNAIHLENAGASAISAQQWQAERAYMERNWSFAALDTLGDRPRLAGYIISGRYEQDWQARGWSEGYIDEIAIYDEARRKRLLRALLGKAMQAYQRDGIDYAGIDIPVQVGAEEPDIDFFMSLGFEITGRTFIYSKSLDLTSSPVRKVVQAQGRRRIFRASGR